MQERFTIFNNKRLRIGAVTKLEEKNQKKVLKVSLYYTNITKIVIDNFRAECDGFYDGSNSPFASYSAFSNRYSGIPKSLPG